MATRSVISKSISESASTYVGVDGELIVDTTDNTLKISNGSTAGGVGLTKANETVSLLDGSDSTAAVDSTKDVAILDGNDNSGEYMIYTLADGTYVGQTIQLVHKSGNWASIKLTALVFKTNLTEGSETFELFSQYDSVRTFIWSGTAWVMSRGGSRP